MPQKHVFAALAAAMLTAAAPAAAHLYKWVDEDGQVHYSDKVPPEAAAHGREVKSEKTGSTVRRVEAAKSPEELEAERRAREAEEARRKAEAEAARRRAEADRTLLLTFSSPADIERFRDDRVALVDGRIALARERIGKLDSQLEQVRKQAAEAERTGRGNPEELHKRAADLERQIKDQEAYVAAREQERADIIAKFDADLVRFKELTARKATGR